MGKHESKHTPGPWRAFKEHPNNPWWAICCDSRDVADVHESKTVAWNNPKAQNEVEANARLIAAAPDLLAACKRLAAELAARLDYDASEAEEMAALGQAQVAIAKAEGREP